MANTLPPLPFKVQVIDENGFIAQPWAAFFREVFARVGGPVALTNTELAALPALNLSAVTSRVTALEASTTTLQGQVNDLNQGQDL